MTDLSHQKDHHWGSPCKDRCWLCEHSLTADLPTEREEEEVAIRYAADEADWQVSDLRTLVSNYDVGTAQFREGVNAALLWVTGITLPSIMKRREHEKT